MFLYNKKEIYGAHIKRHKEDETMRNKVVKHTLVLKLYC